MKTVDFEDVQNHFAELLAKAIPSDSFVITRAGTPLFNVSVVALSPQTSGEREIGFLDGQFNVSDEFDDIDSAEITALFEGRPNPTGSSSAKRTGFMRGQIQLPDDFDTIGSDEIISLFEHGE